MVYTECSVFLELHGIVLYRVLRAGPTSSKSSTSGVTFMEPSDIQVAVFLLKNSSCQLRQGSRRSQRHHCSSDYVHGGHKA